MWDCIILAKHIIHIIFSEIMFPLKEYKKLLRSEKFCCEKISVKNAKIVKENINASVPAKSIFLNFSNNLKR